MNRIAKIILYSLQAVAGILVLSILYYVIFALCFSTDQEKRLEKENEYYRHLLPQLKEDVGMLEDEIGYLKEKDAFIYRSIFKSSAPATDCFVLQKGDDPSQLLSSAARVEGYWREIFDAVNSKSFTLPPLRSPVEGLDHENVGASVGERINPFYKMPINHTGIDLVAPFQAKVIAAAPGNVTRAVQSQGGMGNMVEIAHPGGYKTRYACLDWFFVEVGDRVRAGDCIGFVGNSGRSFSTHLHFELEKDGVIQDPVYWFFDSANPSTYYNMLVMSAVSGQTMD